jgi:hypothetical protein
MDKYQSAVMLEDNPPENAQDARERILRIHERRRGYAGTRRASAPPLKRKSPAGPRRRITTWPSFFYAKSLITPDSAKKSFG